MDGKIEEKRDTYLDKTKERARMATKTVKADKEDVGVLEETIKRANKDARTDRRQQQRKLKEKSQSKIELKYRNNRH